MTLINYLSQHREEPPAWLQTFTNGDTFQREQFFASRIVFYPGSGTDGQPVKMFGSSRAAHCFIYADYGITKADLEAELIHRNRRFNGYHTLARVQLTEGDLVVGKWVQHVEPGEIPANICNHGTTAHFGFMEVLERNANLDDKHGAHRLAILFLGTDGIATYDALFCQTSSMSPPLAIVLEDYGFGGNYERFGRGGLLERIARRCGVMPRWLLVAENTTPWDGFQRVPDVEGSAGGMHQRIRFLHERVDQINSL